MKSSDLKEYIIEQDSLVTILEDLGCKYIVRHDGYYTCGNPDGDNKQSVTVYLNENLTTINYTRDIAKDKRSTDIFDLISFYRDCSFPEALRYVHELLGLNYYQEKEEVCESLQILRLLHEMSSGDDGADEKPLKPISEKILSYYVPYGNKMFEDDGISLEVQQEFEVGLDSFSNYITIPIRDSVGTLVGVKGRYFGEPDSFHSKYTYIERCNKSGLLYGYWQNRQYIKNSKYIYIVESEKGVQQLATANIRNVVATSGKKISKSQVELITRTGCIPIFCYDEDVCEDELKNIANLFMSGISVYAMIDNEHILNNKQSPSDDINKWKYLVKNHIYKINEEKETA